MTDFYWTLHDEAGKDVGETPHFDSREEAEAFMGTDWEALLDQGGESASLKEGDEILYRMGLRET
jgi:hypothetical protein